MHVPSLIHLDKYLETLRGRDDNDMVTITMFLGDLRILVGNEDDRTSPDSPTQLSLTSQG